MNTIALSKINLQAPTQLRLMENQAHIEELAHAYADNGSFHELPWVAFVKETNEYVPIDGFHRLMAVEWLHNQKDIQTDANTEAVAIRYSEFDTMAEAIIAAAGVNATHGLKRQKGDIQNAIRTLLEYNRIDFMLTPYKLNKKAIMETVKCSSRAYEKETRVIRSELEAHRNITMFNLHEEGLSQREIAQRIGCDQKTVSNILREEKTHGTDIPQINSLEPKGESIAHDAEVAKDDEPSVFTHSTTSTVAEDPWAEFEKEDRKKSKPKTQKESLSDDELTKLLSGLSPRQRTLAINYLTDF